MRKLADPSDKTPPSSQPTTGPSTPSPLILEWEPPLVGQWMDSVNEVPEYLIKGILPFDANILMTGKAKRAYKSWMIDVLCFTLASGMTIGPYEPVNKDGVPVLYLAAEGSRAFTKNRRVKLQNGMALPIYGNPRWYFSHREPILLDDKDWVRKIKQFIKVREIKFVAIDPLIMFSRGDENDVKDVANLVRSFNEFRECGTSVLFAHHLAKTQRDWQRDIDEEVRGSSALIGFYDQHWAFRKFDDAQSYNDLIIRSKDAEELFWEVTWDIKDADKTPDGVEYAKFEMTAKDAENSKEAIKEDLMINMMVGEKYTKKAIKEISKLSWTGVDQLIDELIDEGKLTAKDGKFVLVSVT